MAEAVRDNSFNVFIFGPSALFLEMFDHPIRGQRAELIRDIEANMVAFGIDHIIDFSANGIGQ
jgi:hypothetical protein